MDYHLDLIRHTQHNFLTLMEDLPLEALNEIPAGFNNNLIWNFGHSLVSQQLLCYKLSGLTLKIDKAYVPQYRKGSKPEGYVDQPAFEELKKSAVAAIDTLADDYTSGGFASYTPYTTSYGVALHTIEDAIRFVAVHDALHLGYAMALKRLVWG